jgi:hypothetical protein
LQFVYAGSIVVVVLSVALAVVICFVPKVVLIVSGVEIEVSLDVVIAIVLEAAKILLAAVSALVVFDLVFIVFIDE